METNSWLASERPHGHGICSQSLLDEGKGPAGTHVSQKPQDVDPVVKALRTAVWNDMTNDFPCLFPVLSELHQVRNYNTGEADTGMG